MQKGDGGKEIPFNLTIPSSQMYDNEQREDNYVFLIEFTISHLFP